MPSNAHVLKCQFTNEDYRFSILRKVKCFCDRYENVTMIIVANNLEIVG